jgi:hypothetical protein
VVLDLGYAEVKDGAATESRELAGPMMGCAEWEVNAVLVIS